MPEVIALYSAVTSYCLGWRTSTGRFLKRKMQFGRIARMQITGTLVGNVATSFMAIYRYGDRAAGASSDPQAHSALLFGACTSAGEAGLLVLDDE
jgi:hypothetical protein